MPRPNPKAFAFIDEMVAWSSEEMARHETTMRERYPRPYTIRVMRGGRYNPAYATVRVYLRNDRTVPTT